MKKRIQSLDEFINESKDETTIQIGYITSTGALWLEKNIIVNNKDFKKKINDYIKENEKQKNKLIDKWKKDVEDEIFSLDVEFMSGSKDVWKKIFSYVNNLDECYDSVNESFRELDGTPIDVDNLHRPVTSIKENENKVTLNVKIENLDKSTADDFLKMFKFMQWCGSVGAGRSLKAYFDGDGHFRPQITIDDINLKDIKFSNEEDDTLELGFGA